MAEDATSPATTALDQMTSLLQDWQAIGPAAWANPMWARSMAEIHSEIARFCTERLREDAQLQADLMGCTDPVAFREIQGRFFKTAFDQYCAETGKLVQMSQTTYDAMTGRSSGG